MIYYKCVHCLADLETDDDLGSKTEPCPICGKINTVPKSKQQLKEERRQQQTAEIAKKHEEEIKKQKEEAKKRQAAEESLRLEKEQIENRNRWYQEALYLVKKESHVTKNWYCRSGDEEWGPMPESRLQTWISSGRVNVLDEIRPEGVDTWLKVSDIPEIFVFPKENSGDNTESDAPRCPKCGSTHISSNKEGVDAQNACCGALLFGPLGLLCGLSHKVVITCLKCGHQWKAG